MEAGTVLEVLALRNEMGRDVALGEPGSHRSDLTSDLCFRLLPRHPLQARKWRPGSNNTIFCPVCSTEGRLG